MKLLFLHGWRAVPGGVKPQYLAQHGHEVLNPALPDDDFVAAVAIAREVCERTKPDVVIGSSRGGAVAMCLADLGVRLVLLCPAWKLCGITQPVRADTLILHSPADEIIPFADSRELVAFSGLASGALVVTGSDHRLADPSSLQRMLEACTRPSH